MARNSRILSICVLLGCQGGDSADAGASSESSGEESTSSAEGGTEATSAGTGVETDSASGDGDTSDTASTTGDGDGDGGGDGDGDSECPALPGFDLVWCDDFTASDIDATKWGFEVNGQGGGNNELQYYTDRPDNARIEAGKLVIEALEETYTGDDGTRDYTSARLRTLNMGDWQYGRIEVRARTPEGQGLWPAIWMLPTDWVYGGWAASGEIDIMELLGHQPQVVYGTLHYGGEWPNNQSSGENTAWGTHGYTLQQGDFADDFHVFAIEWEAEEIRWYVDGEHFQTQDSWYSDAGAFPAPFDQDFHLILNVAVGGNWPGAPDDSTVFPQRMEVDWVRVYQPA